MPMDCSVSNTDNDKIDIEDDYIKPRIKTVENTPVVISGADAESHASIAANGNTNTDK